MSLSWLGSTVDDMMLDKLVEDRLAEETGVDTRKEDNEVDRDRGVRPGMNMGGEVCAGEFGFGQSCDIEGIKSEIVDSEGMDLLGFGDEEQMEAIHGDEEDTEPLQRSRCNTWPTLAHHRRNAPVTSSSDEHESVSTNSPTGSVLGGVIVHPLSPPSHLPLPPGHPHHLQLQRSPSNSGATLALVSEEGFSEGEDIHGDIQDGLGVQQLGGVSKYKATTSMSSRRNPWGNYSYADLITQAIQSSPSCRLTLSQVYEWMISNIPYFKDKGDTNSSAGWKNSIRHNLSLHQKFVRVQNEGAGKSSWWTINPEAKVGPKPPRRRALSMETSRLEKQRSRAKKRAESRLERASSSISVGGDLFPSSPANFFQHSPDFSRHRTSSNASSCGRLSPTHFRSRTLSNASSVGCNHNSPPSLVEGGLEYQDGVKLDRDLDLDNIHLDNLNIDMFQAGGVKEEPVAAEDIQADSQDQMHKVKILERREPNMMNFFGQQMAAGQDQAGQDYPTRRQDVTMDQLHIDYVTRQRDINQDQLQQEYAARRSQDMGQELQQEYAARRQELGQDYTQRQDLLHRQHQEDLRRREMIRQQQAQRPKSVVKLLEERKLEEMARIQQQARMDDMTRIEETAKMEEEARREEIERIEEAERIEKLRQDEEASRREEEAAREEEEKKREMELLEEVKLKEGDPPGMISTQGGIFMKRERYRKKLMEVTLNQLKEKRVKIQRDNANISYSNKQSLLSACDIKIKLLVEQLEKYEHLDDNRLLNMDTQKELERIGEKVLITEPGLFYGDNGAFVDTMDQDMDNNGLDFSSDFKPLASVDIVNKDEGLGQGNLELGQGDLVQQVIDHELKMEGNLDFTRNELFIYEMREPPGVSWL